MALESDIDSAVAPSGERIRRVAVGDKGKANAVPVEARPKVSTPSPIEEPGKAAAAVRSVSSEVHKTLARDDSERMAAARVLGGELHAVLRDAIATIMAVQGLTVSDGDIDKVLSERAFAGMRVVKGKAGMVVRARKLPRAQAIAYGIGGGVTNAYEKLAAIQASWPWLYAIASTAAHSVAIIKGSLAVASPIKVTPQSTVESDSPGMVDARPIVEDGRE